MQEVLIIIFVIVVIVVIARIALRRICRDDSGESGNVSESTESTDNTSARRAVRALPVHYETEKKGSAGVAVRKPYPVKRKPSSSVRVNECEYMTYRKCPACHSKNSLNRQVIYKIGAHDFVCYCCGTRFHL